MTSSKSEVNGLWDVLSQFHINGIRKALIDLEGRIDTHSSEDNETHIALTYAFFNTFFCLVENLGYLYKGERSSKNAVSFLRDYFGQVRPVYREMGGLLYDLYRHGSIHQLMPKSIVLSNGIKVSCVFPPESTMPNSQISIGQNLNTDERKKSIWLMMSCDALYNDMMSAVKIYEDDLQKDAALFNTFEASARQFQKDVTEAEIRKKCRSYIGDSDFNFLKKQLER